MSIPNYHMASIRLEGVARRALGGVDRFALGGIINADFIDMGGAFTVIVAALAPHYREEYRARIDQFIQDHMYLTGQVTNPEEISRAADQLSFLLDELGL